MLPHNHVNACRDATVGHATSGDTVSSSLRLVLIQRYFAKYRMQGYSQTCRFAKQGSPPTMLSGVHASTQTATGESRWLNCHFARL